MDHEDLAAAVAIPYAHHLLPVGRGGRRRLFDQSRFAAELIQGFPETDLAGIQGDASAIGPVQVQRESALAREVGKRFPERCVLIKQVHALGLQELGTLEPFFDVVDQAFGAAADLRIVSPGCPLQGPERCRPRCVERLSRGLAFLEPGTAELGDQFLNRIGVACRAGRLCSHGQGCPQAGCQNQRPMMIAHRPAASTWEDRKLRRIVDGPVPSNG